MKIFIVNLSPVITQQGVTQLLSTFGNVVVGELKNTADGRSVSVIVEMPMNESRRAIAKLHCTLLGNRRIYLYALDDPIEQHKFRRQKREQAQMRPMNSSRTASYSKRAGS